MSSSICDIENGILKSGYDNPNDNERNIALTEGMTELLSMAGLGLVNISSGYLIETFLTKQLILLVGNETMLDSYFGCLGSKEIKKKLNDIIYNEDMSNKLFRNIEENFNLRNNAKDVEQTILGSIQITLIRYLSQKLMNGYDSGVMNKEEVHSLLEQYEKSLVTPMILQAQALKISNYKGINEKEK